jgi:hypothetical protein
MLRRSTVVALLCLFLSPVSIGLAEKKEAVTESLRAYVLKKQSRQAYGVYVKDTKTGWMIDDFKLGKYKDREVAVQTTEMYLVDNSGGEKSILTQTSTLYYSLEGEGAIVWAQDIVVEDNTETIRTAVPENDKLVITTKGKNRTTTRRVAQSRDTLSRMRALDRWLDLNQGRGGAALLGIGSSCVATFENYSTELEQKVISVKEIYTFREKKSILWGGVKTDVYVVRVLSQGAAFEAELKSDGTMLRGRLGGLHEFRAEKEATAKKLDAKGVDLLAASALFVKERMGDPEGIAALTVEVSGLDDFQFPTSHRQRVRAARDGAATLELRRDFRVKEALPLKADKRKEYLEATPSVQCDDAAIRNLAKKIAGKEPDPIKAARLLEKWVFKSLKKSMAANASTALDVLDNKAGDCTEHSLLFVSLARAAGIPAREVGGLAYLEGKKPLFGWHAWAEIHDGRQWVSVDPTWDEVFVDATHIKFSEGSENLAWTNVVGKIKLKVVRFEKKK